MQKDSQFLHFALGMYMHKDTGLIPPLPRNLHLHKPATLHPLNLSKPMAKRKVSQLKGLKSTPGGKLYRMLTHYSHLLVFFPLGQSYPDPLVGAPCVFLQRITELSSLEGETLRQEKSKKRKSKKTS
uniref:Uncharacterized protein n=1 Tax=Oryzias latipes TaxID=8090 RepID=A0A3B3HIP6_ORYLA